VTRCATHTQVLQDKYEGFLSPQVHDDFVYFAGVAFKK
jgi:hypothetical protein